MATLNQQLEQEIIEVIDCLLNGVYIWDKEKYDPPPYNPRIKFSYLDNYEFRTMELFEPIGRITLPEKTILKLIEIDEWAILCIARTSITPRIKHMQEMLWEM
ncbi:MAG: hypothetical protein ACXQTE_05640 [Methanosarcinaceae archaeon]